MTPERQALIERLYQNRIVRNVARQVAPPGMADDVLQRGLVIAMTKMPTSITDDDRAGRWLTTVVKREAWALHRTQKRERPATELQLRDRDGQDVHAFQFVEAQAERVLFHDPPEDPYDYAERHTAMERRRAAFRRLKPDEQRALLMLAYGLSYREICRQTGWTYTKLNRCAAEGRQALFADLGEELDLERMSPYDRKRFADRAYAAVA